MTNATQNLLKKISYIEAEIEIQKQILHSIPTNEQEEIEKILKNIVEAKKSIGVLRSEIEKIDPKEFQKLTIIEQSVSTFKKISSEKSFSSIESMTFEKECILNYIDGRELKCLVKACDENGDWTVISTEGSLLTIPGNEVLISSHPEA